MTRGAPQRRLLGLALLVLVALWAWAAYALWQTIIPAGLHIPHIDVHHYFVSAQIKHASSYERFYDIDTLLAWLAEIVVLALYARRGQRLMRESAAGPIGTGIMLVLLGYALVWLAGQPFDLASLWWARRHHLATEGYAGELLGTFAGLGLNFVFIAAIVAVAMGLGRALRRWWWLAAAPLITALWLLVALASPYLIGKTHPLEGRALLAEARTLEAREGVTGTPVRVADVRTSEVNAITTGIGPTQRVVLFSTLLEDRFSIKEIGVVMAHEFGHVAHAHLLKQVGWLFLFLVPALGLVALSTRRRGGLGRPEALPLALFVFVLLQLLAVPFSTAVTRHYELESDWSDLQATREPSTVRHVFQRLAVFDPIEPDPPTWAYLLWARTPTLAQRIAFTYAWEGWAGRAAPGGSHTGG